MRADEWSENLAYCLQNAGHGPEQITLGSATDQAGAELILAKARQAAADAGWTVIELMPEEAPVLPESGYLIAYGGMDTNTASWAATADRFQLLVRRDLPVALLVVATSEGIQELRRQPALGWLSRAGVVSE
ncbi:UNVERIFIED_ORG: hypothetical protein ABIB13_003224 [Arthrobacter sp. UYEF2]